MTIKGAIISWRRGVTVEWKGLAAADVENSVPQESLQNWPNLSPIYAKDDTEIGKGEERIVVFFLNLFI